MKRWLVREVIQTSAMDCGPASLAAVCASHGIETSYGRLRDACQTDVDGTSVDTIEQLAVEAGLEAEQVMVPTDHVFLDRSNLPAVAIVLQPGGLTHFIVLWRIVGPFVQVMDPAVGRRWIRRDVLLRDLYIHEMAVPVADWHGWAQSDDAQQGYRTRMREAGLSTADATRLLAAATAQVDWKPLARLDAAIRLVTELREVGAVDGDAATRLLERFATGDDAIESRYFTASAIDGDAANLRMRGAILVRVTGKRDAVATEQPPPFESREPSVLRHALAFVRDEGLLRPSLIAFAFCAAAAIIVAEGILLRALLEAPRWLGGGGGRLAAVGIVLAISLATLLLILGVNHATRAIGRRLETRFRIALLERLPRLDDAYYRSRPVSDFAERAHAAQRLRELPPLLGQTLIVVSEIALTAIGLVWIAPSAAPLAIAAGAVALAIPALAYPVLAEAELRMRTHVGALARFSLDALLGLVTLRAHAAERIVREQHESLLVDWSRAGRHFVRRAAIVEAVQLACGLGFAALLVVATAQRGSALLVIYWSLMLPVLGQRLGLVIRQLPTVLNIMRRCTESLDAPARQIAPPHAEEATAGVALAFDGVRVAVGGQTILDEITLAIAPGEHVAIVGASGSGKSTLLGLLLGWQRTSAGTLSIDGSPLDDAGLARLRAATAWVDPAVQLWNRSLHANLRYGNNAHPDGEIAAAELISLVERLPDGLQTSLGAGGGLVSGGEGQRVRFARALARRSARLVVLDEPFRGLERDRRRTLLDRARRRWSHATLLCVTHDVGETLGFARVLVVERGRIVEDGAPATLAADASSRYAQMLVAEREASALLADPAVWRRVVLAGGKLEDGS